MELTTLCYIHKEPDKPEERTYFETVGDRGKAYYRTSDISKAMFKPADAWDQTIMAEYDDHAEFWYSQILLVYVEVKEVPKKGWKGWTEFKYIRTLREGEDLLAKYKAKIKELKRAIEEITLDLPMLDGDCYLIRSRQDLVNLVDLYPFNWSLSDQLYGEEEILKSKYISYDSLSDDEEQEKKIIAKYRENFYLPGDMLHDKIQLPAVLQCHKIDGTGYCHTYTVDEIKDLVDRTRKTYTDKLAGLIRSQED